jgi:hypothetical protein
MQRLLLGPIAAAIIVFTPGAARAVNCTGLSYDELVQRLGEVDFPFILLDKVHVGDDELRAQANFVECPPNAEEGETAYIYSWRPIDAHATKGLGVSFTFFDFPSLEAREALLQKRVAADGEIQAAIIADHGITHTLESDVYYYVDPQSTKAFRVERDIQYVLE